MAVDYSSDPLYANERLNDTVVMKDNKPVYIYRVNPNGEVLYNPIHRMDQPERSCQLKDLNLLPVKLGYCNLPRNCTYTYRTPSRRYRQGLRNIQFKRLAGVRDNLRVISNEMINTYMGIYPTVENCLELIECNEVKSQAFSRHFALKEKQLNGFSLTYKDKLIGHIKYDRGIDINLFDDYSYLNELLENEIHGT